MATLTRQTLDYSDTATGLTGLGFTATHVKNARSLTITSDTAIRYLTAGTPTASYGHYIAANETTTFDGGGSFFEDVTFISTSGTANLTLTLETYSES